MAVDVLEMAELVGQIPPMEYPDSDGEPMGDNDTQIDLMILMRQGLRRLFAGRQVYVSANVFWYPVQGQPGIRSAPDVIVAFGRPPGRRRSYREWDEGGQAPQVVMEVVSPSNTAAVLATKLAWYDRFGVEEYWVLDPDHGRVAWYERQPGGGLVQQRWRPEVASPRLGIRFVIEPGEVVPLAPDGTRFADDQMLVEQARAAQARADEEAARADEEAALRAQAVARADEHAARAGQAEAALTALRARLQADQSGS